MGKGMPKRVKKGNRASSNVPHELREHQETLSGLYGGNWLQQIQSDVREIGAGFLSRELAPAYYEAITAALDSPKLEGVDGRRLFKVFIDPEDKAVPYRRHITIFPRKEGGVWFDFVDMSAHAERDGDEWIYDEEELNRLGHEHAAAGLCTYFTQGEQFGFCRAAQAGSITLPNGARVGPLCLGHLFKEVNDFDGLAFKQDAAGDFYPVCLCCGDPLEIVPEPCPGCAGQEHEAATVH